jgi:hypothetical protein
MKYLLLVALVSISVLGYEINPEDYKKDPIERLQEIAKEMAEMAQKLRDDRSDTTVQIQGDKIHDDLQKLISLVEMKMEHPTGGNSNAQAQGQSNPLWDKLTEAKKLPKPKKTNWAALPPAQRDEILQTWSEDIPVLWKKRIEAYFISIADDAADRKAEIVPIPEDK